MATNERVQPTRASRRVARLLVTLTSLACLGSCQKVRQCGKCARSAERAGCSGGHWQHIVGVELARSAERAVRQMIALGPSPRRRGRAGTWTRCARGEYEKCCQVSAPEGVLWVLGV